MDNWQSRFTAMQEGGRFLAQIRNQLVDYATPGSKLIDIDIKAEELLHKTGGKPAFQTVKNYKWSTCININEGIVHGIPNNYIIKDGDIVSIDIGLLYKGYFTDTSTSFIAGTATKEQTKFLEIGKQALEVAISQAMIPNHVGHISQAIEQYLNKFKMYPIEDLTGHGVGKALHEPPMIPGFLSKNIRKTPKLEIGQTLAIEVMYTSGSPEIKIESDGWTISTRDGNIAGLFEETIIVLEDGPQILTAVS